MPDDFRSTRLPEPTRHLPSRQPCDSDFLRRVRGQIRHSPDPKVQRAVKEIEKKLRDFSQ